MERLLSRISAPSLFDELDLSWRNLCLALDAADEEIVECRYAVERPGGATKEANERLKQARLRGEKVRREMLKFLDLLDQGGRDVEAGPGAGSSSVTTDRQRQHPPLRRLRSEPDSRSS